MGLQWLARVVAAGLAVQSGAPALGRTVRSFASKSTAQGAGTTGGRADETPAPSRPPRTEWGPRPTQRDDHDLLSSDETRIAELLPLQSVIESLARRTAANSHGAVAWYLLGRAYLLTTTAGQTYSRVVLQRLPIPQFDVELTEADREALASARACLRKARDLSSGPIAQRASLSLGWALELEAQLPSGSSESVLEAVRLYLTVAESIPVYERESSGIFLEAMAEAQSAFGGLSMWKRYWAADVKKRMVALGEFPVPLTYKRRRDWDYSPLLIPLDGKVDPAGWADDQAKVTFRLDPFDADLRWSWVTPNAALLVWDPGHTGLIATGAQLFGVHTWLMEPPDGFAALSMLDRDGDGWVTGAELEGVRLWVDRDGDGVSTPDEVVDLSTLDIRALATSATGTLGRHTLHAQGVRLGSGATLPLIDWISLGARPR